MNYHGDWSPYNARRLDQHALDPSHGSASLGHASSADLHHVPSEVSSYPPARAAHVGPPSTLPTPPGVFEIGSASRPSHNRGAARTTEVVSSLRDREEPFDGRGNREHHSPDSPPDLYRRMPILPPAPPALAFEGVNTAERRYPGRPDVMDIAENTSCGMLEQQVEPGTSLYSLIHQVPSPATSRSTQRPATPVATPRAGVTPDDTNPRHPQLVVPTMPVSGGGGTCSGLGRAVPAPLRPPALRAPFETDATNAHGNPGHSRMLDVGSSSWGKDLELGWINGSVHSPAGMGSAGRGLPNHLPSGNGLEKTVDSLLDQHQTTDGSGGFCEKEQTGSPPHPGTVVPGSSIANSSTQLPKTELVGAWERSTVDRHIPVQRVGKRRQADAATAEKKVKGKFKRCNWCGNSPGRDGTIHLCAAGSCARWVCRKCHGRNFAQVDFSCCKCVENPSCSCHTCRRVNDHSGAIRRRVSQPRKTGRFEPTNKLQGRKVGPNPFLFPREEGAGAGGAGDRSVYSVCTSTGLLRMAVQVEDDDITCSAPECVSTTARRNKADRKGLYAAGVLRLCDHGEAVRRIRGIAPATTPVDFCAGGIEGILEDVARTGALGRRHSSELRALRHLAESARVPLIVRMGETGWFAVRDKPDSSIIGGWAHVKYTSSPCSVARAGARKDRRKTTVRPLECKACGGRPCHDNARNRLCVHTLAVGLCVHSAASWSTDGTPSTLHDVFRLSEYRAASSPSHGKFNSGGEDGNGDVGGGVENVNANTAIGNGGSGLGARWGGDCGFRGLKPGGGWGMNVAVGDGSGAAGGEPSGAGEKGDGGVGEPPDAIDDGGVGTAERDRNANPSRFRENIARLLTLRSMYRFPPNKPQFSGGAPILTRYTVDEKHCVRCGGEYSALRDTDATLVTVGVDGVDLIPVTVERKRCRICGMPGWACGNWRKTGVFNVNGRLLVELAVYYRLRGVVQEGMGVTTWLTTFLGERLQDISWLRRKPIMAERISAGSFVRQLQDGYYAFEALSDHGYFFSSVAQGYYPEILTVDGCVKLATDYVSVKHFAVAHSERTLDADLQHVLVQLSMMSPMVFDGRLRFVTEAVPTFCPFNRLSNLVLRTARGAISKKGSPTSGNATHLLDFLDGEQDDLSSLARDKFSELKAMYRLTTDGVIVSHMVLVNAASPADVVNGTRDLEVTPILTVTDVPCMVAPVANRVSPDLLEDDGALPRLPPGTSPNDDSQGVLSIPDMRQRGAYSAPPYAMPPHHEPANEQGKAVTISDVYHLMSLATMSPTAQRYLNFEELWKYAVEDMLASRGVASAEGKSTPGEPEIARAAEADPGAGDDAPPAFGAFKPRGEHSSDDSDPGSWFATSFAKRVSETAHLCTDILRERGMFALSLFEVVAVLGYWHQSQVQESLQRVVPPCEREEHRLIADFIRGVLVVAAGSVSGTSLVPPGFLNTALFEDNGSLRSEEEAILRYHELKVKFLVDGLKPLGDAERKRAAEVIKGGVGFGAAEHSVKNLQVALSPDSLGGPVDENGLIPGYDISFNFRRLQQIVGDHPYTGSARGAFTGPDDAAAAPHENGGGEGNQRRGYRGVSTCRELAGGISLNPQDDENPGKKKHLPVLSDMGFDTFIFMTSLLNELANRRIDRATCDAAVEEAHWCPRGPVASCLAEVWICGRCFCQRPVMRSFDKLGKLRITPLDTRLGSGGLELR